MPAAGRPGDAARQTGSVQTWGVAVLALVVAVGLVGVVVPVLPGLLLVWGAVAVWCFVEGGTAGWALLAATTAVAAASQVVKYVVPGRRLQRAGIPNRTLLIGGVAGIVGFFVLPVIGLPVGFLAGVYVVERQRRTTHEAAWRSTLEAVKAVGVSILVELTAALLIAGGWAATVVAT